jgi:energy-coupling factor transporter transmembrane protein EcfT
MAMTARGYRPGAPRTNMEPLLFGARDAAVVAAVILLTLLSFAGPFARG